MSLSLTSATDDEPEQLRRASSDFSDMFRKGRSFSGRERNCCFLNTGGNNDSTNQRPRFANVSSVSGIDFPDDGRGIVAVDWDHDGDLDVWTSNRNAPRLRFLRNDLPRKQHFLALELVGDGQNSNRDAIGARVEVLTDEAHGRWVKTVRAGDAFLSQGAKSLHFGLGTHQSIEKVLVHWPGKQTTTPETFTGLKADGRFQLVQGQGTAQPIPSQQPKLAEVAKPVTPPSVGSEARISLYAPLPMAKLSYETFDNTLHTLPIGEGQPVLINLWASWCQPCLTELQTLAQASPRLRTAGVQVLALSVEKLGDERADPVAARRICERLKLPFTTGFATEGLVAYLQNLHDFSITRNSPLPVPASFLVDPRGNVTVIYKGRLAVDTLLRDVKRNNGSPSERYQQAAMLPGQFLSSSQPARQRKESQTRFHFAMFLQRNNFRDLAIKEFQHVISLWPDDAVAHNNLGGLYARTGQVAAATKEFRESLRLRPDYDLALINFGTLSRVQGDLRAAQELFTRAVQANPKSDQAHAKLGLVLIHLNRWAEAQAHLQIAIRLKPGVPDVHANLGRVLAEQGQFRKSIQHLEQALRIQPNHPDASANLPVVRQMLNGN